MAQGSSPEEDQDWLEDYRGSRKAYRDSLGDSPKGSGCLLETRQKITERRPEDSPQECRRLPDWRESGLGLACWSLSVLIIES
ncbi:hypothetical protein BHE74_00057752 [Ensete ventricosum]|nr:hypothetical protein BHE74_00057752 [Ensete ventricosum]